MVDLLMLGPFLSGPVWDIGEAVRMAQRTIHLKPGTLESIRYEKMRTRGVGKVSANHHHT